MWQLDYNKESWVPRNWCFWTVVLEKTLGSPLDWKPVNPKWNQSWIFTGRMDAEVETPILWPPDSKNWLILKDPDAGIDWRWEEKGTTEDEMVGWHHRVNGLKFEQALRVGDGQGSLACCSPWGCKKSDTTEQLNWTELIPILWASQVALMIKNLPANARDLRDVGSSPGLGRSPGGGHGSWLQYSCLENSIGRGVWRTTVQEVAKGWTWLRRLSTHTHTYPFYRWGSWESEGLGNSPKVIGQRDW